LPEDNTSCYSGCLKMKRDRAQDKPSADWGIENQKSAWEARLVAKSASGCKETVTPHIYFSPAGESGITKTESEDADFQPSSTEHD
jgi:hypothetical protein